MKHVTHLLVFGLLFLSACGKQPTKATTQQSSPAAVAGACSTHSIGESFQAEDGCNTCSCRSNGSMVCTMLACSTSSMTMQAGISR